MWFCSFPLFVGSIRFIDLSMLNLPSILEWNRLGHDVRSFRCVVEFCLPVFCWESMHLYSSKILAYNSLFWLHVCWVLEWMWCWLHRMSLELDRNSTASVLNPCPHFLLRWSNPGLSQTQDPLPQPPECWDYRYAPLCLDQLSCLIDQISPGTNIMLLSLGHSWI
jgi:hypothetical protein